MTNTRQTPFVLNSGRSAVTDQQSVIILCGGQGRRLNGADKPLLEIAGESLISRLSHALGTIGPILISARRHQTDYQHFGAVVEDPQGEPMGPLGGLLACLRVCQTPLAFVCPGDCPDVTAALAERLINRLTSADPAVQVACANDGNQDQHLHLALRTTCRASIESYLNAAGRSVHGWLETVPTLTVGCQDFSDAFADIDSLEDLAARQS
jgi:molybdopterin-guanine dinucleotide biosynthesis protein A